MAPLRANLDVTASRMNESESSMGRDKKLGLCGADAASPAEILLLAALRVCQSISVQQEQMQQDISETTVAQIQPPKCLAVCQVPSQLL